MSDELLRAYSEDDNTIPLTGYNSLSHRSTEDLQLRGEKSTTSSISDLDDDPDFQQVFADVEEAIGRGIQPTRISQGSSGSYFTKNVNNKTNVDGEPQTVGVFKPKDEEPYGQLNPKWTKWLHKTCCPCAFGRSCLVPNQGYLSEAGASIVDKRLGLNVVPRTKVVGLASPAFNYSRGVRWFNKGHLPKKTGSLQLFVTGFKDAETVVDTFWKDDCDPRLKKMFSKEFERLVILDYIIRNTDRGNDNWLVKIEEGNDQQGVPPSVKIAAIDNGLAFPFKHPDSWRTYPYYWAWLPQARVAFSDEIRDEMLPLVSDESTVEQIVQDLYKVFREDPGFSKSHFERQMGVLRGQCLNLATALRERKTPLQMVQMPVCVIRKKGQTKFQKFLTSLPRFSRW